ncbi:unnamed protein product [Diplocarpon coronariae]
MRLLQLRTRSLKHSYIFDINKLGGAAMFKTMAQEGQQSQDALIALFGMRLGVIGFQLVGLECRNPEAMKWLFNLALEYSAGDVDAIEKLYDAYAKQQTRKRSKLVHKHTSLRFQQRIASGKSPASGGSAAPAEFATLSIRRERQFEIPWALRELYRKRITPGVKQIEELAAWKMKSLEQWTRIRAFRREIPTRSALLARLHEMNRPKFSCEYGS